MSCDGDCCGGIKVPIGPKGDKGDQGVQGVQGVQGPQGAAGVDGVSLKKIVKNFSVPIPGSQVVITEAEFIAADMALGVDADFNFQLWIGTATELFEITHNITFVGIFANKIDFATNDFSIGFNFVATAPDFYRIVVTA